MVSIGCFIGLSLMVLGALMFRTVQTKEELDKINNEKFYAKCQAVCLPNGVYSTNFNRCLCDVNVVYKEVK
jgi:hypothetical protein